jgi:ubiquinone/menaquinone biosynthesis C-methylase UbiE
LYSIGLRAFVDVCGGHGIYSIGFSKLYPHLEGAVFDLKEILKTTTLFLKAYKMENKIRLIPGDILKDEFPDKFDMAFMSDATFRKEDAELAIKKLYSSLNEKRILVPCTDWSEAPYALIHEILILIGMGDITWHSLPSVKKILARLPRKLQEIKPTSHTPIQMTLLTR